MTIIQHRVVHEYLKAILNQFSKAIVDISNFIVTSFFCKGLNFYITFKFRIKASIWVRVSKSYVESTHKFPIFSLMTATKLK